MLLISSHFNMRKIDLGAILWMGLSLATFGYTDTFIPKLGFAWDSLTSFTPNQESGYVFQNPAGLAGALQHQLKVETAQAFFGYQQINLAYVLPTSLGTLGFGYFSLYTSDINRVSKTGDDRPQAQGTLGHSFQNYVIAASTKLSSAWQLGANLQLQSQTLDTDSAFSMGADVGVIWNPIFGFWMSGYTQNLINTGYRWNGLQSVDRLTQQLILSAGFRNQLCQGELSSDFQFYKLRGEWILSPQLKLVSDYVTRADISYGRYSYGTVLDLGQWSLQYLHLTSSDELLDSSQDILGISLHFGAVVQIPKINFPR